MMSYVQETLNTVGYEFNLIQSNICIDELPAEIQEIALANIDVDMYEPTIDALNKIAKLMKPGGIIIAEDPTGTPGLYGALVAMDEFLSTEIGSTFTSYHKGTQYFLVKQ
jgi:hypothetical protein